MGGTLMASIGVFDVNVEARQAFEQVWSRAFWHKLATLGRGPELASFQQVTEDTTLCSRRNGGLQSIPVDCIHGSVSDNRSFDGAFRPRRMASRDRWTRVYIGLFEGAAIPPIEVYKVGDTYYVEDGHHRVSVARVLGMKTIEALVTEIVVAESVAC